MSTWYYEFGGKKVGPVPSETLHHLADFHAIRPETNIWKDDMEAPVHACKAKNLFPASTGDLNMAHTNLTTALSAVMDEDEKRLVAHRPRLLFIHSSPGILIDYKIISITTKTVPDFDPNLAPEEKMKPIRHLFDAQVLVTFCDRPLHPCPLAELRISKPGRRVEAFQLQCTEFADGDWKFWDGVVSSKGSDLLDL